MFQECFLRHSLATLKNLSERRDISSSYNSLNKQVTQIIASVTSESSNALLQKFRAIFQCRENFCIRIRLNVNFSFVSDHSSRKIVVIGSIKRSFKSALVDKFLNIETIQAIAAIDNCSIEKTRQTLIHIRDRNTVKISSF